MPDAIQLLLLLLRLLLLCCPAMLLLGVLLAELNGVCWDAVTLHARGNRCAACLLLAIELRLLLQVLSTWCRHVCCCCGWHSNECRIVCVEQLVRGCRGV
jgi:hypothetical protein